MKKVTAEAVQERLNLELWSSLVGDIEKKHIGNFNSWVAETFLAHYLSANTAGIRFAVQAVIEDCFSELETMLETDSELTDEEFYMPSEPIETLLKADPSRVFGFLVDFIKEMKVREIEFDNTYNDRLKLVKPKVLEYQENFESYTISRINKALEAERGKALEVLKELDI